MVDTSTFGLIKLPPTIRLCLALAACRPPELLRGLRSLGPPTLDSETLLLTSRQSANKIYETSLCQKCIFKNCIGLRLKFKNSPISRKQSGMHREMRHRLKIVIRDPVSQHSQLPSTA